MKDYEYTQLGFFGNVSFSEPNPVEKVKKENDNQKKATKTQKASWLLGSDKDLTARGLAEYIKHYMPKAAVGRNILIRYFIEEGIIERGSKKPRKDYVDSGMFYSYESYIKPLDRYESVLVITPLGQRAYIQAIVERFTKPEKKKAV